MTEKNYVEISLEEVKYSDLNHKQKESYNFQKVSSHLANYGYTTIRLYDDYKGADFIAKHYDKPEFLKIQLKSRLTFDKKYCDKQLFICFPFRDNWYLYNHDLLMNIFLEKNNRKMYNTKSWNKDAKNGGYSIGTLSKENKTILKKYKL